MNRRRLINLALSLGERTAQFVEHARAFFYRVVLCQYVCPACGNALAMIGESRCRCEDCQAELDPTVTFQRCDACGEQPRLRIRRYECSRCGTPIDSRFVFDGLVFDAEYFREKMAEHRRRRYERAERVRAMLAGTRSGTIRPWPVDLGAIPGLEEALNSLTAGVETQLSWEPRDTFDLVRYERHIQAHIGPIALTLDEIPPLSDDARLDRIRRFIAIIFLAHAGLIEVWQDGSDVMVMQSETNREGQDVSRDIENTDGIEGFMGRVEG